MKTTERAIFFVIDRPAIRVDPNSTCRRATAAAESGAVRDWLLDEV
jgi:hypothetical protein